MDLFHQQATLIPRQLQGQVYTLHGCCMLMCTHQSICVWHQTGTAWRQSSGRSSGPSPPTLGASCVWRGMAGSAWLSASWEEGFSRASHSSLNFLYLPLWYMDYGNLYLCTALVLTTFWEDNEFCWHIEWKPLKVCKATNLISEYWMTYILPPPPVQGYICRLNMSYTTSNNPFTNASVRCMGTN